MNTNDPFPLAYVGNHAGPRRTLTMVLRGPWPNRMPVHVTIDGTTYVLSPRGPARFEVPADRPVHVSAHLMHQQPTGHASTVLMRWAPPELEYRAPHMHWFAGEIGPPGSTSSRGAGCMGLLIVVAVGIAVVTILVLLLMIRGAT